MTAPGRPSPHGILTEAWRAFWSRPTFSLATAGVVALVCVVTLGTTGRTAATEQRILAQVDSLGTRLVTVTDTTGSAGIATSVVDVLRETDGVDWVFALGPAQDATLPGIGVTRAGSAVAARAVVGDLPSEVALIAGRPARSGEATAGTEAATELGLISGAGAVDANGATIAVVGTVAAEGPLASLNRAVLVAADRTLDTTVRYVYVRATEGYDVQAVAGLVEALVPSEAPAAVDVSVADGALALHGVLSGTLGESARQLMATVLGVGLLLVGLTTMASVSARRRDFGRRRALGASRSALVALVVLECAVGGALGASVGSAVGLALVGATSGEVPPARFTASLVALGLLVTVVGAVPPALVAARRDPVRILRVP